MAAKDWPVCSKTLKGVILDLCGVLYDSGEGGGVAISGSVEALKRLKASNIKLRFCTNESQEARPTFVAKLQRLGFDISVPEVFSPAPAAVAALQQRGLRPHLLVCDGLLSEFDSIDKTDPNCVLIGDAAEKFSYQNLNKAFRILKNLDNPLLLSLGQGKYYKETDGLSLDVGAYMNALEYACDVKAEVFGKPSSLFFQSVLNDMGLQPNEVVMIGDDLVNDVGGAQQCGIKGIQVRTGKYSESIMSGTARQPVREMKSMHWKSAGACIPGKYWGREQFLSIGPLDGRVSAMGPSDETHQTVTADGTVDNLAQAVDVILSHRR